jgi:hypothetical protein
MKKTLKFLSLVAIFFILPAGITQAESGEVVPIQSVACSDLFSIEWPIAVKVGSTHEYLISSSWSINTDFTGSITYTLRRDNKVVETIKDREKYLRYFTTPWNVVLEATIPEGTIACEWRIKKEIRVYSSVFTYIWTERVGIDAWMNDMFERNNILYKSYIQKTGLSQAENASLIWETIDQSDDIVIGGSDILGFFSDMVKLQW